MCQTTLAFMLKAYCIPSLTYGIEVASLKSSQINELNNCINLAVMKIFGLRAADQVSFIKQIFGNEEMKVVVNKRTVKFYGSCFQNFQAIDVV